MSTVAKCAVHLHMGAHSGQDSHGTPYRLLPSRLSVDPLASTLPLNCSEARVVDTTRDMSVNL